MNSGLGAAAFHIPVMLVVVCTILLLILMAFWIWMIIDCATKETDADNNRLIWLVVLAIGGVIGSVVYYFVRRRPRPQRSGS